MKKCKIFTRNAYGVQVCMCCASCAYKELNGIEKRLCMKGEGQVKRDYVCKSWKMAAAYENAGKGDGKVKKLSYLKFALESGVRNGPQNIDTLRETFSRYDQTIYDIDK